MNARKVAFAAIAAAVLVALVVASEVLIPRWSARRDAAQNLLLAQDESVRSIALARGDAKLQFDAQDDGAWLITASGREDKVVADIRAITMLVESLRGTRVTSVVGPADAAVLPSYGLAPPRLTLSWSRPGGRAWTLALGRNALGGQVHALADDRVLLVPDRILAAADHGLDHFRVKRVLEAPEGSVTRIEIRRRPDQVPPGASPNLVLERVRIEGTSEDETAFEWMLREPLGVVAQPVRVASLLSRLSALSALGFGEEISDEAALERKGLRVPAATLALTLDDGRTVSLAIGDPSPAGNAWARVDDGPIVEIRSDVARDSLLPDDFWRDNRVVKLPKWRMVNLQLRKGSAMDVEMAREPDGAWTLVKPTQDTIDPTEADTLLEMLGDISCGRFEDELAQQPGLVAERWNFDGPGSIDLDVLALMPDGSPRRAVAELTPFLRERQAYFATRTMDELGRVEICVTTEKSVDTLLDQVRKILGTEAAP